MDAARLRFDAELSGLGNLGIESAAQLLDPGALPSARAQVVGRGDTGTAVRVRFPLPGTPEATGGATGGATGDAAGRLTGAPRGAGTGWVVLERWNAAPWGPLMRARFTRPRSASLAERAWNLFCHLRAAGVGTPQPLAVGAAGAGPLARDSFLVTRELAGYETPAQWIGRPHRPEARRRAFTALGSFLANLFGSGVFLPQLALDQLRISAVAEVDDDEAGCDHAPGLKKNRMPGIALTDVTGGVIREHLSVAEAAAMLRGLAPRQEDGILPRERARLFLVATRRNFPRGQRRAIWRACS